MKAFSTIGDAFSRWIDCVAEEVARLHGWLAPARVVKLIEVDAGNFAIETDERNAASTPPVGYLVIADGKFIEALTPGLVGTLSDSRIELFLRSDRFLFAPLELPGRAAEFLDGVVRAQIDRLTPWKAAEAVFGWSKPTQSGTDRFIATIAAAPRARIAPFVQAISGLGVRSSSVFAAPRTLALRPNPSRSWRTAVVPPTLANFGAFSRS